jgi:hypothetical protein
VTRSGRIAHLFGTRPGEPFSLAWFREPGLAHWVRAGLCTRRYEAVLVYSSAMATHAPPGPDAPLRIVAMVDLDSEKWRAYAASARRASGWSGRGRRSLRHARARGGVA